MLRLRPTEFIVALLLALLAFLYTHPREVTVRAAADAVLLAPSSVLNTSATVSQPQTSGCRNSAVYILWSAGTTAGGVQVETANVTGYAGTWAALGTPVAWTAANKQDVVQLSGVFSALRTRISTTVVGGTVSTWFVCY